MVTCRDYGKYLDECLKSLLNQTIQFKTIVVVDDGSKDNTREVAAAHRVRYERVDHGNVALARNHGVLCCPSTPFICCIDADDYVASNYHEKLLRKMDDPSVGVAYSGMIVLHEDGRILPAGYVKPFDFHALRVNNYVNASALFRREVFDQAGGWIENAEFKGLEDWMLWLRATRKGWTLKHEPYALLFYRRHSGSMSQNRRGNWNIPLNVIKTCCHFTIISVHSGREWHLERFLKVIRTTDFPKENLHVAVLDNSCSEQYKSALLSGMASSGVSFAYRCDNSRAIPTVDASELGASALLRNRNKGNLSRHLSRLYAVTRELVPTMTDFVLVLEDDIEPPENYLSDLLMGLLKNPKAGVCGASVRSRFTSAIIARGYNGQTDPYVPVLSTGFGCTLFRKSIYDSIAFRPSLTWDNANWSFDWSAAENVREKGHEWLLATQVKCKHYEAGRVVEV